MGASRLLQAHWATTKLLQSLEAVGPWQGNSSASSLFTPGIFPPPHSSGLLGYPQHPGRTDRLICHLSNYAHGRFLRASGQTRDLLSLVASSYLTCLVLGFSRTEGKPRPCRYQQLPGVTKLVSGGAGI